MKFTLVTSFYNGSQFVNNLYNKVLSQTYTNWEWIVTDDYSSDNCRDLIIEIAKSDRRVKYVEQKFKKEMFYNPQRFCKHAEVIMQLDQDDYPLPKALEVYHHFFTKFPDTDLIACSANMFREDGSWMNFHNPDFTEIKNMACGYLTTLRAWRNNPNIEYEFNPNNWMQYYYNDLAIVCTIEERGRVLNLPRNLYYYNYRENSISRSHSGEAVKREGDELIAGIHARRFDKNMDTLNRHFESIHKESLCLMDHHLNNSNTQVKIAYIDKEINFKNIELLKTLFFDHDFNINKLDGNEDVVVFVIKKIQDVDDFFSYDVTRVKRVQVVIWNQQENSCTHEALKKVAERFPVYSYQAAYHMIIDIIR